MGRLAVLIVVFAHSVVGLPARAAPGRGPEARPLHPATAARGSWVDAGRRIDINRINLAVSNDGRLPWGPDGDGAMVYPKGSDRSALFTAGLRLGGRVGGETRVAVVYYASEYGPGAMVGGAADDPARPEYRVYKVARWTGRPADSAHVERTAAERAADPDLDSLAHHSWSEYMSGAAPHGAPWRVYRLPVTATPDPTDSVDVPGPDVLGDQMLWCVYNDADPALQTVDGGQTAPLGIEVRQTTFAYDRPGPLGSTVFLRYDLHNRGSNTIAELRTSMWGDFDIGGSQDDLAGCMESRSLGYMYNSTYADWVYGAAAPALGFDLLAEHDSPTLGRRTGMDAFLRYVDDSTEPFTAEESFHAMQGLANDGSPIVDPTTGQPTPFMVTGDPVEGTGWLDAHATDRRIHCSAGPWTLAPGDSLTLWVALVVGQADTPIRSVAALRCADDYVQSVFDSGFAEPFPAPPACALPAANCPRGSDWWGAHCADGRAFTPPQWQAIADRVDSLSVVFDFSVDPGGYCAALHGPWATARDSAKREYVALLSNVAAGDLGLVPAAGEPVRLARGTQVSIPPLTPNVVSELIRDQPDSMRLVDALYENHISDHRRAYTGVNWGGSSFFGGAGTGSQFYGSTLDPGTMPDSFATVELRFSRAATQRAYRFLRLERASDGTPPPQGRVYPYAGYHDVNLTCWDTRSGAPLELAFVERCLTDDGGTILPPASQPATFDSTWGPDASLIGGREYLFVLRRPYGGSPVVPAIGHDGAVADTSLAVLYALWARLRGVGDVVDDGDAFRFVWGYPPTGSAERLFQWLEPLALTDSSVVSQYRAFAAAAADVNRGFGIGAVCGAGPPVAGTLIEARTEGTHVTLRWRLAVPAVAARLETRNKWGAWLEGGPARIDGDEVTATGSLCYDDYDYDCPEASRRWYRLAVATPTGLARTDSVSLSDAYPPPLAVVGAWPNPSLDGRPRLEFTLPSAGTVWLEVFDPAGRRVARREIPGLDAGTQLLEVAPGSRLRAGVYFVRLRFGAERRTARLVVLN